VTLKHTLSKFIGLSGVLLKNAGRKPLREILQASADGYLQEKFNLLPMLSDLTGIHRSIVEYKRTAKSRLALEGRVIRKHYSFVFPELKPTYSQYGITHDIRDLLNLQGYVGPDIRGSVETTRTVVNAPTEVHVQCMFKITYDAFRRQHADTLTLLDKLGVNFDLRIIWNAIPWSFVVDWVLKVQDFLSQFRIGFMDPRIDILQCLWSVKRSRVISMAARVTQPFANPNGMGGEANTKYEHIEYPDVIETAYRRQTGIPDISLFRLPEFDSLSFTEASLATALAITRKRVKLRKKRTSSSPKTTKPEWLKNYVIKTGATKVKG
jgi:hypothetical protein